MQKIKFKNTGGSLSLGGRKIRRNEVFEAAEAEIPKAFKDIVLPLDSLPEEPVRVFKHKRYPGGENLVYDLGFEARFNASQILNEKNRSYMNPAIWQMATPAGLKGLIKELEGQAERAAALIGSMDTEFENRQVTARRNGQPELETMPADLRKLQLETEARLDVTREELDYLGDILSKIEAREAKENDKRHLLTRGPCGSGKLLNGVLAELDGQPIKVNKKGELVINCPKSPYHKMNVVDYRRLICEPFRQWQRQPLTKEELDLGPHRPAKDASDPKNWPARPGGCNRGYSS
jgi:hypothetical protein